jgi:polyisoprenoid-binding protein YceI
MTFVKDGLAHFAIDTKASLFTVQAFASGIVAVVGHSPKFAVRNFVGEMEFGIETMENASLQLMINIGSLEIMDEVRATERREIERVMFNEVLETHRFPKVEYKSSRVTATKTGESLYRVEVLGDLTLHGITRSTRLESQVMAGQETLKAQGSFSIMQSDYGLKIASVASGTLKLKDELKCGYFIVARRTDFD